MKAKDVDLTAITPEMKKFLLENHQPAIEVLQILARLIKNPLLKWVVSLLINLLDMVIDKIKAESEQNDTK